MLNFSEDPEMSEHTHQEALLASIRQAAQVEREKIVTAAEAEVARIEQQADEEVAAIEANARQRATHTADFETDRALARTEAHIRRALAQKKRQLLDEAFAQAQQRLAAHQAEHPGLTQKLLDEALARLGPQAQGSTETVRAASADGRRGIDNSLQTRLERARSLHSQDIAVLLFETSDHE
jgi:vacuolar-type H+-ATPase subunit E/Vma4